MTNRFNDFFKASRPNATSEHSDIQAPEISDAPLSKSKDPGYKRTTVYLPADVHRQLKARAANEGREMSDIIETLVTEWLKPSDV